MKKLIYKFKLLPLLCMVFLWACDDFGDTNIDPKSPTKVDPAYLFSNAETELASHMGTSSVNQNVGRLLAQYWSQTTYTSESRYQLEDRQLADAHWNAMYRDVLNNLKTARELVPEYAANEKVSNNQTSMITVLEVYAYQMLVDVFGDIPYTGALGGGENRSPEYDDAATIYNDLAERLNAAINNFDESAAGFGGADLLYGDDIPAWIKFANSLKIRLGMRLADYDPAFAQNMVESAHAQAFTSNEDNAEFEYVGGSYANPVYADIVLSGRRDYVISNTLVDYMAGLGDPRLKYFMTPNADGEYVGLTYGLTSGISDFDNYSQIADAIKAETFPTTLLDYAEVEFFLAEAAQRGWNVAGTAEAHYNNAVTASILNWGGTAEEAADYLAKPEVAFATAEGGDAMQAIAMQKWLSLYNQGLEGWIEWRRLDYPVLNAPQGMEYNDIPKRFRYPVYERSTNNANREEAAGRIGGDDYTTKVFWDVD